MRLLQQVSPVLGDLQWIAMLSDDLPWISGSGSAFETPEDAMESDRRAAEELALWSETYRGAGKFQREVDAAYAAMFMYRSSGEWAHARPIHFLALHCFQHELVFGVRPIVARADLYRISGWCKAYFDSDPYELARYMRWVWRMEETRIQQFRANGMDYARTTFRLRSFFHGDLITSYRAYRLKEGK